MNSAAAVAYVAGTSSLRLKLEEVVGSATVQGTPFGTWAGPVSLVFGGEKADTITAGIVYSPSWLSGLTLSFDYYRLNIKDAIITPTLQSLVNQCAGGNTALCGALTRDAGGTITSAILQPFNLAKERLRGFDIEGSYSRSIAAETRLNLRALFSHVILHDLSDGITTDRLDGENAVAPAGTTTKWRGSASLGVEHGPGSMVFTGRYTSPGKYDDAYTPAILADNRIAGAVYFDLSTTARVAVGSKQAEFFFNVDNLFNKDPVIVSPIAQPFFNAPINSLLYDTVGREFKVGVRVRL